MNSLNEASSNRLPDGGGGRKFSFLVNQERQRKRDEEVAAAREAEENSYRATVIDYLIFGYFCLNCFFLGCPLLNSNAAIRMWRSTDAFSVDCRGRDEMSSWCPEQLESAKIGLVLFQSAAAASAMMGGALVDTFSASMCMLLAHLMFGAGAYLLQSPGTRGIFVACVLQGAAGELLLNSVLPICGLFGKRHNIMLLILTLFNDLSILVYPIIITFIAPDTPLASVQELFYQQLQTGFCYAVMAAGIVGTFILPVDDDGNLMPSGATASVGGQSINKKPHNLLSSPVTQRFNVPDEDEESLSSEVDSLLLLLPPNEMSDRKHSARRRRVPRSLWNMRFTRQLRTPQFFIVMVLSCFACFRCSFYFNNNQQLLERVGDDGTLTEGFMWILALGALFGPISWQINDNWSTLSSLSLFCFLLLSVNVLAAVNSLKLQWLTLAVFACARSSVSSTLLTYIAGCFGFRRFPAMSIIVGLAGAFFNFLNIIIDRYVEHSMQGDYVPINYAMIGVGVASFMCVGLHGFFPTLKEEPTPEVQDKITDFKKTLNAHEGRIRPSIVLNGDSVSVSSDIDGQDQPGALVDEDEWEDEIIVSNRKLI